MCLDLCLAAKQCISDISYHIHWTCNRYASGKVGSEHPNTDINMDFHRHIYLLLCSVVVASEETHLLHIETSHSWMHPCQVKLQCYILECDDSAGNSVCEQLCGAYCANICLPFLFCLACNDLVNSQVGE